MANEIKPTDYIPRIVDSQIDQYLAIFGAIEIAGPKWCGKTWTARAHAASISYVDQGDNISIATADPALMLLGDTPHVIDEWQLVPSIWDTVRHAVDESHRQKGLWILTGSSTPKKTEVLHSGAGRIGRIRMQTMSSAESGYSSSQVSLLGLFNGDFISSRTQIDLMGLVEQACRGGWPETITFSAENSQLIVREYLRSIYEKSLPELGKSPDTAERLIYALARNLGQSATLETLRKDTLGIQGKASEAVSSDKTVSSYLEAFNSLFLIDNIKGWAPANRSPERVRIKEKRYFADPSIAIAALGMSTDSLINDWQTFGLVFENLCIRDLQVYARALPNASNNPVRFYRDDSGLEVDAIIERADGSWGAFEIKTSEAKLQEGVNNLLRLRNKLSKNPRARAQKPSFLAVIVGTAEYARVTPEGVFVIPIRLLGA